MPVRIDIGSISTDSIVGIHGTVDLYSDVTIGTVSINQIGSVGITALTGSGTITPTGITATSTYLDVNIQGGSVSLMGVNEGGTLKKVTLTDTSLNVQVKSGSIALMSGILGSVGMTAIDSAGSIAGLTSTGTYLDVNMQGGSVSLMGVNEGFALKKVTLTGEFLNVEVKSGSVGIMGGNIGTIGAISPVAGLASQSGGQINVLSTSTTIIDGNNGRKYASIQNVGGTPVYLGFGTIAQDVKGIRLAGGGGFYEINQVNLWQGSVSGITASTAGTTSILIVEW